MLEPFLGALEAVPAAPRGEPSFHAQVLEELQAGRIDDGQAVLDTIPAAVAELKRPRALMAFARRATGSGLPEISVTEATFYLLRTAPSGRRFYYAGQLN